MNARRTIRKFAKKALGPSQIEETQIVYDALRGRQGVMLDVGAHYGYSLAPFADDGWVVHAFEPDPTNRTQLDAHFGRRQNVRIVSKAVSEAPGELPLYTSEESTGISSLAPFSDGHQATATVEVTTLADYFAEQAISRVDFLKVDVEGFEASVLRGYDWTIKPHVIVLEFEDAKTAPLGYRWTDLAEDLRGRGYEVLVSEWFPIDRYGGAHTWRRFARYPTELQDADAWGNLIASASLERDGITRAAQRAQRRLRVRHRLERLRRR